MQLSVKYLQERDGRLSYRRRVPLHLRAYLGGRREIRRSLGLTVMECYLAPQEIKRIDRDVSGLLLDAERQFFEGRATDEVSRRVDEWVRRSRIMGPWDHSAPVADATPSRDSTTANLPMLSEISKRRAGISLTDAIESYTSVTGGKLGKAEATAFEQLGDWLHKQDKTNVEDVDRKVAGEFVTYLARERGQSPATVQRRLNSVKALWTVTIDQYEAANLRNPWSKLKHHALKKDPSKPKASQAVLPFNKDHWRLIDAWCAESSGPTRDIIVLLKATGCRPLEITGLHRSDVTTQDGIPVLHIRPNSNRRLKTHSSERMIPVVSPDAKEAIDRLLQHAGESLFRPALHDSNNTSQLLNKALRRSGIPRSRRLIAYSIRHSVIEALRSSSAQDGIIRVIAGHSENTVTARYGAGGYEISTLANALAKGQAAFGDIPRHVYTREELAV